MRFPISGHRLGRLFLLLGVFAIASCKSSSSPTSSDNRIDEAKGKADNRIDEAKRKTAKNLRLIGCALLTHHDAYGIFPSPGLLKEMKPAGYSISPYSWRPEILPWLEQRNLYNQLSRSADQAYTPVPDAIRNTELESFRHPWDRN